MKAARKSGLSLSEHDEEVIRFLSVTNAFQRSRYIEIGSVKRLPPELISETCASLDEVVSNALKEHDQTVWPVST